MPVEATKDRRAARAAKPAHDAPAARAHAAPRVTVDIERMFSGHRRSPRHKRLLAVQLRSSDGRVCRALTVDVSRGGVLLDVNDGRFFPPGDPLPLIAYAGIARDWLRDEFEITFQRGGVRAEARLVRAVLGPRKGAPPLLGCRFTRPLPEEACRRLGLDGQADGA